MADKSISELVKANEVRPSDLLIIEQAGTAKKLEGQTLENWLVSFADGHGGIHSWEKLESKGLVDNYKVTLADKTAFEYSVTNGKSITSISKTTTAGLTDTYTISYNDGTSSTFRVTNGSKGDKGDNTYTFFKYAAVDPATPPHSFGDVPDDWLGIYAGPKSSAPTLWSDYKWVNIKGVKGDTGDAATVTSAKIEYQVSSSGTVAPSGVWSEAVPAIGKGKFLWTRTTVNFNSGDPVVSYAVAYIGKDGTGTVNTVNNVEPDAGGNIKLTAADVVEHDGITTDMLRYQAVFGNKLRPAMENTLGGIKGPAKTEKEIHQVHIDKDGNAWVGGIEIVKLWENASPESSFGKQTISFASGKAVNIGDVIMITCNSGTPIVMQFFKDGISNIVIKLFAADYNRREFIVHANNVEVDTCWEYKYAGGAPTAHNNLLVPQAIYKIKI